ncbi:hypothetical protein DL89DRAFT_323411 [Linderina pennispora]|uniref:Uncharacterized protein n=1 Tax=Linderina pennispora TaxID=61395 RepID=A0A1Y1W4Q3_9FUNG|nr:uncharacterized protein DL89DRAFT_323411 [Linderina pennispora]ORX68477.1 hypothetical protein DL89DRAFT_323411 [Linderina pennispora]
MFGITSKSLASVGQQVQPRTLGLVLPYVGQVIDANELEDTYVAPIITLEIAFKLATVVSNLVYASLYGADFGDGVQAFSTLHLEIGLGTFVILPSRPPSKDLVANICVALQGLF